MVKETFKETLLLITLSAVMIGCSASTDNEVKEEKCVVVPPAKPIACTMQYDPVCGCDGKTYGNACGARGAGVPHSTPGACEESSNN